VVEGLGYVLAVLGLPIDKFVLDPAIHWKPLTEFQVRVRKNGTNVHPGPSIQQVGASESNHYFAASQTKVALTELHLIPLFSSWAHQCWSCLTHSIDVGIGSVYTESKHLVL